MKRILLLLLLVGFAFAQGSGSGSGNSGSSNNSPPPAPIINIDLTPLTNAIIALPGQIISAFFTFVVGGLSSAFASLRDMTFQFIFSSPDPSWFCGPYNGVLAIVDSLFALVLMGMALFFILRSGDVEGRIQAKKWMENMIVMAIVLALSFQIFVMLNGFNTYLTNSLASQSMSAIFGTPTNPSNIVFAFMMLVVADTLGMITLVTLLLRYILMPVMLLLFPVAIFLYFIPPLQGWGKSFLKIIGVCIFMTTADALVMVGLSAMFNSLDPLIANVLVRSFVTAIGFAALGFVNIALVIMALLSILIPVGGAVVNSASFMLVRKAIMKV